MASDACKGCSKNINKPLTNDESCTQYAIYLTEQIEMQQNFNMNYLDGFDFIYALEVKREIAKIKNEEWEKMKKSVDRNN